MDANQIQQELFQQLRTKQEFVSTSVLEQENGDEYVLVRLLDNNFDQLRATIPNKIEDTEIKVEKSGPIVSFSL